MVWAGALFLLFGQRTNAVYVIINTMDMDEYQVQAIKSIAIKSNQENALAHRTLGLTGEAGIVANRVKKIIRDKKGVVTDEDVEVITKRLGDVLYYVAALADYYNIPLSQIAQQNINQSKEFLEKNSKTDD